MFSRLYRMVQSSMGFARYFFILPLNFLIFNLSFLDAFVGFVFRRAFGLSCAFFTSSRNLRMASSRFCSCVRYLCASITRIPPCVMRFPAIWISRVFASSRRKSDRRTSKRSCTAVATLLTFCPPGPEERIYSREISLSRFFISRKLYCRQASDGVRPDYVGPASGGLFFMKTPLLL